MMRVIAAVRVNDVWVISSMHYQLSCAKDIALQLREYHPRLLMVQFIITIHIDEAASEQKGWDSHKRLA
jgi:hypothetical protein